MGLACFNKSGNGCTLRRFLPSSSFRLFSRLSFTSGGLSPFVPTRAPKSAAAASPRRQLATRRSLEYQMTPERTFVSLSSLSPQRSRHTPLPLLPSCKDAHRAHHKTTKPDRQKEGRANRQRTVSHLPPLHTMCVCVWRACACACTRQILYGGKRHLYP